MEGGSSIYFSSILQIRYVEVRISGSISESPFDFEITRVDCMTLTIRETPIMILLFARV